MLTGTGSASCTRRAQMSRARIGDRIGDGLVLTPRPCDRSGAARAGRPGTGPPGPGGRALVRPARAAGWLPARMEWQDLGVGAALIVVVEEEGWRARPESRCCAGGAGQQ